MSIDEMISVLQAAKEGKPIQALRLSNRSEGWEDRPDISDVAWQFGTFSYRVKPEPKVIWVNRFPNGYGGYAYSTEDEARAAAGPLHHVQTIRFVESAG